MHRARALRSLRFSWTRSGVAEVTILAAFVAVVYSVFHGIQELPTSLEVGLGLALVPTAVWMVYVYRLDRVEPEPWTLVLGVGALAALLYHAVLGPVAEGWLEISHWQHRSDLDEALAQLLVLSPLQQFCAYLAVRYTVYMTDEFDDPIDGIVYATAAGLGVATLANVELVTHSSGILPVAGATAVASRALVSVAAAAALGYGMGRARFSSRPMRQLWLGGGFGGSVLILGGLRHAAVVLGVDGGQVTPWITLAVSLTAAVAILTVIDRLSVHLIVESLRPPRQIASRREDI